MNDKERMETLIMCIRDIQYDLDRSISKYVMSTTEYLLSVQNFQRRTNECLNDLIKILLEDEE